MQQDCTSATSVYWIHVYLQGLGLEYARRLVAAGARTLVLTSRDPRLPLDVMKALATQGVTVFTVHADATDTGSISAVLAWVHEHLPHLGHVVHAAGVSDFHLLQDMENDSLWNVAKPKV